MSLRFYKSRIKSHNAFGFLIASDCFRFWHFLELLNPPPQIHILNSVPISCNFCINPLIIGPQSSHQITYRIFSLILKWKTLKYSLSSLYEVLIIQSVRSRYVYWILLMINYPLSKQGLREGDRGTFYNRRSSLNLHDSPISYVLPFLVIDKRDDIFINDLPSMIMIVIITILTFSEGCCKAASLSLILDGNDFVARLLSLFHII